MPDTVPHAATNTTPAGTIPEHHLVLIAAAVASTCGECARILRISPVEDEDSNSWTRRGRIAIHNSHRLAGRYGVSRLLAKQDPGATRK